MPTIGTMIKFIYNNHKVYNGPQKGNKSRKKRAIEALNMHIANTQTKR